MLSSAYVGYLADTRGEAPFKVQGVVVATRDSSMPLDTRTGRRAVPSHQVLIAIPSKKFWWNDVFRMGSRLAVHVVEGRFTHWLYVSAVDAPALTDFNDAIDEYDQTARRIRDDLEH